MQRVMKIIQINREWDSVENREPVCAFDSEIRGSADSRTKRERRNDVSL